MAEQHDADADREEGRDRRDGPGDRTGPEPAGGGAGLDEEAAWAAIVAAYGDEPSDPPGAEPPRPAEDPAPPEGGPGDGGDGPRDGGRDAAKGGGPVLGGSVVFAPGVGPRGPRDYEPADEDEGHFVPPEPPPLPESDPAVRFGWLGVVGGPVLMLLAVLLGWDMTWWLTTVCVGGFLGGFATLVARMRPGDDEEDDPGRGAVV
ncbi:hypothetical protein LUX12_17190 [Streptomyces somaliensis]|uniref:hypothetical protein n=1 Tax=Streptomyces somaliensis TaxID=78355 RepID=UPI0020CCD8B9|nr:hypothetical protein [Streptomyces somaliensis]MCP9946146.1 hypothetical protein [Streptomyces somaliensis]MCP9960693.1 hypothetical protein [Streptomyces somaliensis]